MTVQRGQTIVGIAEYIRVFVEPALPGVQWESRIRRYQRLSPKRRYKMGASRSLAAYYFVLTLSLFALGLYLSLGTWWIIAVVVLLLLDLAPVQNLWRQASFGWKFEWERVRDDEAL